SRPVSRSPSGTQADSPLQRAWTKRARSGSSRRNAAQVSGAAPASQRAVNRSEPTRISSIPSKGKANRAMGGLGVAEDFDGRVGFGHLRCVPEAVLRLEADLGQPLETCQQPGPHLVNQVLDGHADEVIECLNDGIAHRRRIDARGPITDPVFGPPIAPVNVEVDEQGPVGDVGQRRVGVAGEIFEGAARQLDEAQVAAPAAQGAKPGLPDLQFHGAVVVLKRAQQFRTVKRKGNFPQQEPQPLHLRISCKEAAAQEGSETLVAASRVFQRRRIDEVLHGIGGYHVTVIALGIGGHEVVAEDIDAHPTAEQAAGRMRSVEGHLVLAVPDLGLHERSRSAAMSTIAFRPSSISSARERPRRRRSSSTISDFGRWLTKTTKRKPKRPSYSALSRSSSGIVSSPCSWSERVERRLGSSPFRGWALSVTTFSSSVSVGSRARICAISSAVER